MPSDHFELREKILSESSSSTMANCVEFINARYEKREELQRAVDFCFLDLMEAPKADVQSLGKVGFFPWAEASKELDQSLSLILRGHFKHAYDSFRRAVELVVTGAFYVSEGVNPEKARAWMESDRKEKRAQQG